MAQSKNTNQYSQRLLSWVQSKLNVLIGADDFAPLLLSLNDNELQNYCNDLLGSHNATTQSFVNELIAKRNQEIRNKQQNNNNNNNNNNNKKPTRRSRGGKNKQNDSNKTMSLDSNQYPSTTKKSTIRHQSQSSKKVQSSSYRQGGSMTITHAPISKKTARSTQKKQKKRRKACGCQATLHDVFKNCTECGNILCMLEGEGPCFHCSAFVTLAGSIPNINNSALSFEHTQSDSYKKAVAQKDKLLRFGREKIAQTTIIDDQGDFYETEANNLWLTNKEREIAKQKAMEQENKLNESRADKAIEININLSGDRIGINEIDDNRKQYVFDSIDREKQLKDRLAREQQYESQQNEINYNKQQQSTSWYHNSSLTGHASKVYASLQKMMNSEKEKIETKTNDKEVSAVNKLKNKFIEEANSDLDEEDNDEKKAMEFISKKQQNKNIRKKLKKRSKYTDRSDEGVCLSMHQPWASLLVLGIKQVEGRSWSTKYKGRLWIASARREPTPFEIDEVEQQYCKVYGLRRDEIPFPKEYPTTALLGCVDMVNCLSNEQYQKEYIENGLSTENNASSYCFMCENPRRLILPGAISGEHKLWKMPLERIKPMQAGLVPCNLSWIPDVEDRKRGGMEHGIDDEQNDDDDDGRLQKVIADSLQQQ